MPILDLLLLPFLGPLKGLAFVARHIAEEGERAWYDEDALMGALLDLEIQLQDGEISQEEYTRLETELVERLGEARRRKTAGGGNAE
ncbi:MAG: gas vesicle protein GvpG [Chloroflexi bacterium]|nr:gas vesicle protein GvpG [Chloroflexota bacterium]